MNDILERELKKVLESGGVSYENTPPFIVFEKPPIEAHKFKVYILKDNKVFKPHFSPAYNFFKLDIRDFAALFQAFAHGAKDAFRDFVLEFFERKIQKRIYIAKTAYVIEARGTKNYNKSSHQFLKEVKISSFAKWKKGLYINSDPVYFFNWAIQEDASLRLFYVGTKGYALGKLTNQKLGELSLSTIAAFGKEFEVIEYIPGLPLFDKLL